MPVDSILKLTKFTPSNWISSVYCTFGNPTLMLTLRIYSYSSNFILLV